MDLEAEPQNIDLKELHSRTFGVEAAARRMGLSASYLYKLVQHGQGPEALPQFKTSRFTAEALDAFVTMDHVRKRKRRRALPPPTPQTDSTTDPDATAESSWRKCEPSDGPTLPAGAIDWSSYAAYAPRVVDTLEGADTWPPGIYLTPLGLLVRLGGSQRR